MSYRGWCFTLFNYGAWGKANRDEPPIQLGRAMSYLVYGKEVCPKTKRPHLQGYVQFTNDQDLASAKRAFEPLKPRLSVQRGKAHEAADYCLKPEPAAKEDEKTGLRDPTRRKYWAEFGVLDLSLTGYKKSQGMRTELLEAKAAAEAGASESKMLAEHPVVMARFPKYIEAVKKAKAWDVLKPITYPIDLKWCVLQDPAIAGKKRHFWIMGPPDSGKTTRIQDTFEGLRAYMVPKTPHPFERYRGHEVIIYDDIIPGRDELINISNVYKIDTHVHGHTRYHEVMWLKGQARTIIVLSNLWPVYKDDAAVNARFNWIDITP